MIVTDYDLAFCKHALYCIYDKLIDQSDTEYYCNVYGIESSQCSFMPSAEYSFCNILAVAINKTNFDEVKKLLEQK